MNNNIEILLSVYPKYNEVIKSKVKNFEFRPYSIISDTGFLTMWIYETKPTMALKYKMTVKNPVTQLSKNLDYGLGNEKFLQLINDGKFAYEIVSFEELTAPISLMDLRKIGIPAPQGYAYLNKYPELKKILKSKSFIQHF